MSVEVNPASETLQIRHKSTGKWSPGMTLLRLEEGYDVCLIESQMERVESIARQVDKLATLTSVQDVQRSLETIVQSLASLLTQETSQSTNVARYNEAIGGVISQLVQISQSTDSTNKEISTQLSSLSGAISSLNNALSQLGTGGTGSTAQQGETDIYETLVSIEASRVIKACPLPNTTRSLVFSGRRDNLGRSHDIHWSFGSGNLDQGNYKILWAYNEFQKTGLNFKDKVLYLSCGAPIQIDVTAYFS